MRSPAAWAFAMVVGAPMLAEAQQGGLFPLAPIRRQRVPCPMEDPVYGLYRHEYYGYHPTCWRRFPAGWGCPSPEAPNATAEFQKRRRDDPPPPEAGGPQPSGMEGDNPPAGPGREETPIPPVPNTDRSPFETDTKPGEMKGPAANPRTPPPGDSPLELPPPAESNPEKPARPATGNQPPPTSLLETPSLPGPDNAPLLALPDPASPTATTLPAAPAPRASSGPVPPGVNMGNPLIAPGPSAFATPAPVQAPRRTSLIGGLFGGLSRSRR